MTTANVRRQPVVGDAVVPPVRGGNAFEEAVARIVQTIKLGVIGYGERLPPERELALQLGVSRVTLRSAIRALQQAGYIESHRGRAGGSFVVWDPADAPAEDVRRLAEGLGDKLIDALLYRDVIEPGAAALAAKRDDLSDEQRQMLLSRLEESRSAPADAYRMADCRLHLAIAELSGSPSLHIAVADVQLLLNDLLGAIPLLPSAIRHSHQQHQEVVDAILNGQESKAGALMHEHVDATASLLRGFLR